MTQTYKSMELARRLPNNPLVRPQDVKPSLDTLEVEYVVNPGAFRFNGKIYLLMRVAERPRQRAGVVCIAVLDPNASNGVSMLEFQLGDPMLDVYDARGIKYGDKYYVTTLSHLRLASSVDGVHFEVAPAPTLLGQGELESSGIEDCRVTKIDGTYYLMYTAVSPFGFGIGLITTKNWVEFNRHGMILPPLNKNFALFPEMIDGYYYALHRPTFKEPGRGHIWISRSPNMRHWGDHHLLAHTRPGMWDEVRIGAGSEPIRTDQGWLQIYHGVSAQENYYLGGLLLDPTDPTQVLARSREPIMEPTEEYELTGFTDNVIFSTGHIVDGDTVIVYYGAADKVICGARFSISEILASLQPV